MQKEISAFSLIEVIIATVILTMGVFGVYKIIGNNMSLLSDYDQIKTTIFLEGPLRECLKSIGYDSLSGSYNVGDYFSIHFGTDFMSCQTGSYNQTFDFTGVHIDNQDFFLYSQVQEKNTEKILLKYDIYSPRLPILKKQNNTLTIYK